MAAKKDPQLNEPLEGRGPGAHLRNAREQAGMSVDAVAEALLLNADTLRLLEADAHDRLPAPTFVRGYLRGYARVLGLPSGPILDMYDRQGFEPPPLMNEVTDPPQADTSDTPVRLVTYAVAVVLALLVGLWWHSQEDGGFGISGDLFDWLPDADRDPSLLTAEESGTSPEEADADEASVAMASDSTDELPQDGDSTARPRTGEALSGDAVAAEGAAAPVAPGGRAEVEPAMPSLQPDTTPGDVEYLPAAPAGGAAAEAEPAGTGAEGAPVVTASLQPDTAPEGAESGPAAVGGEASATRERQPEAVAGIGDAEGEDVPAPEGVVAAAAGAARSGLVIEFAHESWVEVYDRERARLFFNLVQPGRVLNLDGPRPFDVLLGYGKDARVTIDGEAFDHTPYLRHGVARFSVGSERAGGTSMAESGGTTTAEPAGSPAEPSPLPDRGG